MTNKLPVHAATMFDKVIEPDNVAMEITPVTTDTDPIVRTLSIGEPTEDFRTMHKVISKQ